MRDTLSQLNADMVVHSGPTKSDRFRNRSKSIAQSNHLSPTSAGLKGKNLMIQPNSGFGLSSGENID